MSTTNTTPSASDADIEAYIRQIASDEASKLGKAPETNTDPAPLKMNIGGQDREFKDLNEAQAYMNTTLGNYQTELNTARQSQGRKVTSDSTTAAPTFDQTRYVDLMVKDPGAAADYVDEHRFGFKDPVGEIKKLRDTVQTLATNQVVENFKTRNPEYEATEANALAMQQIMQEMNLPVAPAALEAAYAIAQKRGLYKATPKQETNKVETNPYLMTPPVASRGSAATATSNIYDQAEDMPLDQLEKLLTKFSR